MKTSLVVTVLNEGKTIRSFVQDALSQSKKFDEIIIVDGGSTDDTVKVAKSFKTVKVVSQKGNRSIGRNAGIKKAIGEFITVSDAGCRLDEKWHENLRLKLEKNVDVVAGFYKPLTHSIFEKCLATYTCVMLDKIDPQEFLPSSRSIGFRKNAWEKVGGYPEYLDTCEDLVFASNMKKISLRFSFAKNAFVLWPQRHTLIDAFIQFYNYAIGDGMAHYFRKTLPYLYGRYVFGILLLLGFIISRSNVSLFIMFFLISIYIIWSIQKNYRYVKSYKAFYYLPLLQFCADLAVMSGTIVGIIKRWATFQ